MQKVLATKFKLIECSKSKITRLFNRTTKETVTYQKSHLNLYSFFPFNKNTSHIFVQNQLMVFTTEEINL